MSRCKCVAIVALAGVLTVSSAWAQAGRSGRWASVSNGNWNWDGYNWTRAWDGNGRDESGFARHDGQGYGHDKVNQGPYRSQHQYVNPVSFSQEPITIRIPAHWSGRVAYSLNSHEYVMRPGQQQNFRDDRSWLIRFDRGGNLGSDELYLSAGSYEFNKSNRGWELYPVSDDLASRRQRLVGSTFSE